MSIVRYRYLMITAAKTSDVAISIEMPLSEYTGSSKVEACPCFGSAGIRLTDMLTSTWL